MEKSACECGMSLSPAAGFRGKGEKAMGNRHVGMSDWCLGVEANIGDMILLVCHGRCSVFDVVFDQSVSTP